MKTTGTDPAVLPRTVVYFNAPGSPEAGTRIARALGCDDAVPGPRALVAEAGMPSGLKERGLREDQLDEVAERTEKVVPPDNPVPVGGGVLRWLVQAAWEGTG